MEVLDRDDDVCDDIVEDDLGGCGGGTAGIQQSS